MRPPEETTYRAEHSPNCPSPYLVRICGYHRGVIDGKPVYLVGPAAEESRSGDLTGDAIGYGTTFEEAYAAAWEHRERQKSALKGVK